MDELMNSIQKLSLETKPVENNYNPDPNMDSSSSKRILLHLLSLIRSRFEKMNTSKDALKKGWQLKRFVKFNTRIITLHYWEEAPSDFDRFFVVEQDDESDRLETLEFDRNWNLRLDRTFLKVKPDRLPYTQKGLIQKACAMVLNIIVGIFATTPQIEFWINYNEGPYDFITGELMTKKLELIEFKEVHADMIQ